MSAAETLSPTDAVITRFTRLMNTTARATVTTWPDLFTEFSRVAPFKGDAAHPGWSAARFEPPKRAVSNVQAVTALVLDYDNKGPDGKCVADLITIDQIAEAFADYYGLIHTTRNHTADWPRFRVILPLAREVTAAEYARLWRAAATRWPGLDPAPKDPSRFWYTPGIIGGSECFEARDLTGAFLDPDELMAEQLEVITGTASVTASDRHQRARAYIAKMPQAISGAHGHDSLWAVARKLICDFELTEEQAMWLLRTEYNPRCQPPWDEAALLRKVREAATKAKIRNPVKDRPSRATPTNDHRWLNSAAETGHVPAAPSRFVIVGPDVLFQPLEEPDYLIEGVIRRGSLTELVAYGSSGKSWMKSDAGLSVATGLAWLGRFPVKQGRALLLDWENGLYEERRRLQAIARARNLTDVQGIDVASMPSVYMTDPAFETEVMALAQRYDLIVIDTLKAASPGVDENDSNIRVGLDALRRIAEKTGCAFLVLVHSKKTSGSATTIDPREAGRGSSAIFDAADAVLHCTYVEGEPLKIVQTKSRLGRPVEPFQVSIVDTENGGVSVIASDMISASGSASDDFERRCDEALAIVRDLPSVSSRVVRERMGCRYQTTVAALEMLERHGAVRNVGTDKAAKWIAVEV